MSWWVCLQLLDIDPQDQAEEDGGHMDLDSQRKGKCAVIKTSTRQVSVVAELTTLSGKARLFFRHTFFL